MGIPPSRQLALFWRRPTLQLHPDLLVVSIPVRVRESQNVPETGVSAGTQRRLYFQDGRITTTSHAIFASKDSSQG